MYDAQIGRFPSLDPKANEFAFVSPYNYAENSPIANIDLWGLQKIYFQNSLKKNPVFLRAYQINRFNTDFGKQFGNALANQNEYNVVYYSIFSTYDGKVDNIAKSQVYANKQFIKLTGQPHYMQDISDEVIDLAYENNTKKVLFIGISTNNNDDYNGIYDVAKLLNHEEGAHALDILLTGGTVNDTNTDHNNYYGINNSQNSLSPNDCDVEKMSPLISPAKKNYDQIKEVLKEKGYEP